MSQPTASQSSEVCRPGENKFGAGLRLSALNAWREREGTKSWPTQSHRSDSNRRPAVYKTAVDSVQALDTQQLADLATPHGTTGGTKDFSELEELTAAWDGLPEVLRAGIMAMIRASATPIEPNLESVADEENHDAK